MRWLHRFYKTFLPFPTVAAKRSRQDARVVQRVVGIVRPVIMDGLEVLRHVDEHNSMLLKLPVSLQETPDREKTALIPAWASQHYSALSARLSLAPLPETRCKYLRGVLLAQIAYARELMETIKIQAVVCRQLISAQDSGNYDFADLLFASLIESQKRLIQLQVLWGNASLELTRRSNPLHDLTRARLYAAHSMIEIMDNAGQEAEESAAAQIGKSVRAIEAIAKMRAALKSADDRIPPFYKRIERCRKHPNAKIRQSSQRILAARTVREAEIALEFEIADTLATFIRRFDQAILDFHATEQEGVEEWLRWLHVVNRFYMEYQSLMARRLHLATQNFASMLPVLDAYASS